MEIEQSRLPSFQVQPFLQLQPPVSQNEQMQEALEGLYSGSQHQQASQVGVSSFKC